MDPVFRLMRFHSMVTSILFEKLILFIIKDDLESPLIFVLFFKRVNKIRKKTLSVTLYFGKGGL